MYVVSWVQKDKVEKLYYEHEEQVKETSIKKMVLRNYQADATLNTVKHCTCNTNTLFYDFLRFIQQMLYI